MDDDGEMSSYVFTALGLYTFSATDPEYLVTVPLFDEVKWKTSTESGPYETLFLLLILSARISLAATQDTLFLGSDNKPVSKKRTQATLK